MNETRVAICNELQSQLFRDSWNAGLGRFHSRCAFRGFSDAHYPLGTTLRRLGGNYAEIERHLLRNFKKYAHATS
jgi:hypothetical protein